MMKRIVVLLLVGLLPSLLFAGVKQKDRLKAFVLNVSNDCLLIVSIDHRAGIVHLAGIGFANDDSGKIQAARDFIRSRVMNKTIRIILLRKDRAGNLFGRVYINESCLNDELVKAGYAEPAP